ncbi:phosphotransferase-like protein [Nocardia carnea]|uniref:phosphotransferase-like protein n=1 Tax=Nocardia carnea TaxID=37328 RepID=UPI003D7A0431
MENKCGNRGARVATPGRVVLLNGVSSSGKSSIARRLLIDLDRPFFHMGVDMFGAMRSESRTHELDPRDLAAVLRRTRAGFHRAVAGMAWAGNDIVMDHVLSEPWRLPDCLAVMTGIDVVFVGVHCPPGELRNRERRRADRPTGTAASQLDAVHAHDLRSGSRYRDRLHRGMLSRDQGVPRGALVESRLRQTASRSRQMTYAPGPALPPRGPRPKPDRATPAPAAT